MKKQQHHLSHLKAGNSILRYVFLAILITTMSISYGQRKAYKIDSVLTNPLLINNADMDAYRQIIVVAADSVQFVMPGNKKARFYFAKSNDSASVLRILKQKKSSQFLLIEIVLADGCSDKGLKNALYTKSYTSYQMFRGATYLKIRKNLIQSNDLKLKYDTGKETWLPQPL